MVDFFWRCYARALSQPQPKFIQRLEAYDSGPVTMPKLWQVMIAPLLVLVVAALIVLL